MTEYLITAYFGYSADSSFEALLHHSKHIDKKTACKLRVTDFISIEEPYIHPKQYKIKYQFCVEASNVETAIEKFRTVLDAGTIDSVIEALKNET